GAWFGELIRREIGGTWIGDGVDPRRLRLLLEPQFVHFSPVDMASEAILSGSLSSSDRRSRPARRPEAEYGRSPTSVSIEPGDPRLPDGRSEQRRAGQTRDARAPPAHRQKNDG